MRKPKPDFPKEKVTTWAKPAAGGLDLDISITLATATLWKQEHGSSKGGK
jgi:hypothetical protein